MLCRIIFCIAVSLATLSVILLSLLSPVLRKHSLKENSNSKPWVALSLYIQQPYILSSNGQPVAPPSDAGAFIFHRTLTEGHENISRIIGKAQGFVIPLENFAHSAFNIIYLTFDTPHYAGSLSVQAKHIANKDREELTVVGGTGSSAFAHGLAVFVQTNDDQLPMDVGTTSYHVKLQLRFPNHCRQTIPG